jgi:hypothetical protein
MSSILIIFDPKDLFRCATGFKVASNPNKQIIAEDYSLNTIFELCSLSS